MQTLTAWLIAMVTPLVGRILSVIGFGFLSYSAIKTLISNASNAAVAAYNGLPADVLNFANLAGVGECLSIAIASLTTRAALVSVQRLARITPP